MIWRCTLLLALCAFSSVRSMTYNKIEYRVGGPPGNPCSPECYAMIRQWFMSPQQACTLPYGIGSGSGGNGGPPYYGTGSPGGTGGYYPPATYYPPFTTTQQPNGDVYIDYYNNYQQIESLKVSGPCFGYQLCDKCGPNGQCIVDNSYGRRKRSVAYGLPVCKCKEGYTGDVCDEKVPDGGQNNVIIAVTVIAGLLAFLILIAVIVHICWKHKGGNKPNHVKVFKPPGHHCNPPVVNQCGPVGCSNGHPSVKATCNMYPSAPLRIHAATPMHGHQQHYPPMGMPPMMGGPCCPPRSTVKITEIVEDNPYGQSGAVVPAGGLFGSGGGGHPGGPNVYTTIGAATAGGTTITL